MNEETLRLYARARAGDEASMAELLVRYEPQVQVLLRRGMGPGLRSRFETVDLSQSVFREALVGAGSLQVRSEPELIAWLAQIAHNKLRKKARELNAAKRDGGPLQTLDPTSSDTSRSFDPPAREADPADNAARRELRHHLALELRRHDRLARRLFLGRYRRGRTWEQLAAELGLTVKAAQNRYYRLEAEILSALAERFG